MDIEELQKLLTKVSISNGIRCNIAIYEKGSLFNLKNAKVVDGTLILYPDDIVL